MCLHGIPSHVGAAPSADILVAVLEAAGPTVFVRSVCHAVFLSETFFLWTLRLLDSGWLFFISNGRPKMNYMLEIALNCIALWFFPSAPLKARSEDFKRGGRDFK